MNWQGCTCSSSACWSLGCLTLFGRLENFARVYLGIVWVSQPEILHASSWWHCLYPAKKLWQSETVTLASRNTLIGRLENPIFFSQKSFALRYPGFHRFKALGSLNFFQNTAALTDGQTSNNIPIWYNYFEYLFNIIKISNKYIMIYNLQSIPVNILVPGREGC